MSTSQQTEHAVFERIFARTLTHEGGYSDHPQDRGGETRYGITNNTLKAFQDAYIPQNQADSLNDNTELTAHSLAQVQIANLSQTQARHIYRVMYYQQPKIYLLTSAVQPIVFDMAVNHGPSQSIKILQQVMNLTGIANIAQDGVLGPITARACDNIYQQMGHYFINALCDERIAFYQRIVARHPSQQVFLRGWINRANTYYVA